MKKLKIALIIDKFDPRSGGVERYTQYLAESLTDDGHELHVFCRRGSSSHKDIVVHEIPTIGHPKFLRLLTFVRGVKKHVKKEDYDIVHGLGHNPGVTVLNSHTGVEQAWFDADDKSRESVPALLCGRIVRFLSPRRQLILLLQRQQYRDEGVRAIVSHSDKVKNDIMRFHGIKADRIQVIYNGIDITRFKPQNRDRYRKSARAELGLAEDEIMILTATNNYRLKGVFPAIRMLPLLERRVKNPFRLIIAGRDDDRPYRKEAERLGVSNRVVFMNYVEDIVPLYAAADIFLLPTFYDTFGNVILEAIASGLPVVTTRNAGASVFVRSKIMGRVLDDPRDHEAMAEALSCYFPEKARIKALAVSREVYTQYTKAENARMFQEIYERVLSP
jgi:UDP-glucose:(heptosyl)LPS alpha-1,3-glucosyltransferase